MKTVAGKAGSLSEGELYRLSTNDYANLIELLDQDETVPQENVSVFKRRVTLVTSIDNGKTVSEQETPNNMDEKVPSDIARLHHIPKKRVPLPKMYLEFDQNKISELESDPIQLVEFLLEEKLLTKPESCIHCGHGKDFIHLIHSTHYHGDSVCFKCSACLYYYSVRSNSFFSGHHLTLVQLLRMSVHCSSLLQY